MGRRLHFALAALVPEIPDLGRTKTAHDIEEIKQAHGQDRTDCYREEAMAPLEF